MLLAAFQRPHDVIEHRLPVGMLPQFRPELPKQDGASKARSDGVHRFAILRRDALYDLAKLPLEHGSVAPFRNCGGFFRRSGSIGSRRPVALANDLRA